MKRELKKAFKELYPNHRILAVQLNGFDHKVFFDAGTKDSAVQVEYHNPHLSTFEHLQKHTDRAKKLLQAYPTYAYKNSVKEIMYVLPSER